MFAFVYTNKASMNYVEVDWAVSAAFSVAVSIYIPPCFEIRIFSSISNVVDFLYALCSFL